LVPNRIVIALSAFVCVLGLGTSCRTPPLPPANFAAPGWQVLQGQAVWKPAKNKSELAGELLLGTNANGNFFAQFGKTPFPLATAQAADDRWQIEFGSADYRRAGRGQPPSRFVWFQLPRALLGAEISRDWRSEHRATNSWRLENLRTGETLEAEFFQSATSGKAESLKQ
jgi:hypothetical protein